MSFSLLFPVVGVEVNKVVLSSCSVHCMAKRLRCCVLSRPPTES